MVFVGILFLGCAPAGLDFEQSQVSDAYLSKGKKVNDLNEEKIVHDTNPLSESNVQIKAVSEVHESAYVFGEGDSLKVTVFQEDDLSGEYKIDNAGFISFPLIGKVKAAGVSADVVVRMIEEELSQGYLRSPDVMVEVASYRPFSVLGEVASPGNYPYMEGFSIADAVAVAGGFTYRANRKGFEVLRRQQGDWKKMETRVGDDVQPGDIIYVRERMF